MPTIIDATLITDIGIHAFILWSFLIVFFFIYISKIEKDAFEDEFASIISENLPKMLAKADAATSGKFKQGLQNAGPILDIMHRSVNKDDPEVADYNSWLRLVAFSVSGVLFLLLAIGIYSRWSSCAKTVPLPKLFVKNAVTFLLVAVVEFLFFWYIGKNYVPAKPSQLVTDIITRMKANLAA